MLEAQVLFEGLPDSWQADMKTCLKQVPNGHTTTQPFVLTHVFRLFLHTSALLTNTCLYASKDAAFQLVSSILFLTKLSPQ